MALKIAFFKPKPITGMSFLADLPVCKPQPHLTLYLLRFSYGIYTLCTDIRQIVLRINLIL